MKILVSWSSGKDSAWTLHVLRRDRIGDVAGLLTSVNEAAGRVSMHGVREEIVRAQADAARLPLFTIPLPWPCSNEVYETGLRAAVDRALEDGFTHIAFGDLFLEDIRRYREDRLANTGLTPLFPLWGLPTSRLAREMIAGHPAPDEGQTDEDRRDEAGPQRIGLPPSRRRQPLVDEHRSRSQARRHVRSSCRAGEAHRAVAGPIGG